MGGGEGAGDGAQLCLEQRFRRTLVRRPRRHTDPQGVEAAADAGDGRGGDRPFDAATGVVGADRVVVEVGQALVAGRVEHERLPPRRPLAAVGVDEGVGHLALRAAQAGDRRRDPRLDLGGAGDIGGVDADDAR
jgi:hypothetical protein